MEINTRERYSKMSISDHLASLINRQICREIESSQIYRNMHGWLRYNGYEGFAKKYKEYYLEELKHADMFMDHLLDRNGILECSCIECCTDDYNSILNIVEKTLEHEQFVTSSITEVYNSVNDTDLISKQFLYKMLNEQIEEEEKAQTLVDRVKLAGNDRSAILVLDGQLM